MKKFALLFFCCMLLGGSLCNAELTRGYNKFNDAVTINSILESSSEYEYMVFQKMLLDENAAYLIKVENKGLESSLISEKPAEIKIDKEPSFKLECADRSVIMVAYEKNALVKYNVPVEVAEKIRSANRVAVRFFTNNGFDIISVLSPDELAEWKEVIATKE